MGAFLLLAAFVALALAVKRRSGPLGFAAAGALFGLTILTRTDLMPVPFLIAGLGGAIVLFQQRSLKPALLRWGMVGIAAGVVLAPWTIYASARGGPLHPRDQGLGGRAVRRHLPPGRRHDDGDEDAPRGRVAAAQPEVRGRARPTRSPPRRRWRSSPRSYPGLSRDEALEKEARKNLIHYSTHDPVAFAQMQWAKAKRMWFFYYRGGGVHYISTPMRIWQVFLVLACGAGLLAGLIRRRDPVLGAVLITMLFSTAIHTIVVSQARYNVPLMPSLIAAGVAGWFLARAPGGRRRSPTATRPCRRCRNGTRTDRNLAQP